MEDFQSYRIYYEYVQIKILSSIFNYITSINITSLCIDNIKKTYITILFI